MTEECAATVADDFRDRQQVSSRCDLVVSDELLPAALQQLSLTLHAEGFKSFDVTGKKSPSKLQSFAREHRKTVRLNKGSVHLCKVHNMIND